LLGLPAEDHWPLLVLSPTMVRKGLIQVHKVMSGFVGDNTNEGEVIRNNYLSFQSSL